MFQTKQSSTIADLINLLYGTSLQALLFEGEMPTDLTTLDIDELGLQKLQRQAIGITTFSTRRPLLKTSEGQLELVSPSVAKSKLRKFKTHMGLTNIPYSLYKDIFTGAHKGYTPSYSGARSLCQWGMYTDVAKMNAEYLWDLEENTVLDFGQERQVDGVRIVGGTGPYYSSIEYWDSTTNDWVKAPNSVTGGGGSYGANLDYRYDEETNVLNGTWTEYYWFFNSSITTSKVRFVDSYGYSNTTRIGAVDILTALDISGEVPTTYTPTWAAIMPNSTGRLAGVPVKDLILVDVGGPGSNCVLELDQATYNSTDNTYPKATKFSLKTGYSRPTDLTPPSSLDPINVKGTTGWRKVFDANDPNDFLMNGAALSMELARNMTTGIKILDSSGELSHYIPKSSLDLIPKGKGRISDVPLPYDVSGFHLYFYGAALTSSTRGTLIVYTSNVYGNAGRIQGYDNEALDIPIHKADGATTTSFTLDGGSVWIDGGTIVIPVPAVVTWGAKKLAISPSYDKTDDGITNASAIDLWHGQTYYQNFSLDKDSGISIAQKSGGTDGLTIKNLDTLQTATIAMGFTKQVNLRAGNYQLKNIGAGHSDIAEFAPIDIIGGEPFVIEPS